MTFLDRQCFVELPLTELSEALVNRDMGSRELARVIIAILVTVSSVCVKASFADSGKTKFCCINGKGFVRA